MTNIFSSSFVSTTEIDGRHSVHEVHVDLLGLKHDISYLADAAADLNAALATHATDLGAALAAAEIASNVNQVTTLGSLATVTMQYSIAADNIAALRAAYAQATQTQAIMIGDYLNTLTSAQLQTAFGLTAGQVTTLKTNKLGPAATLATSIRSAAGQ